MAGNTRKTGLEQFYTPDKLAEQITRYCIETVGVDTNVRWIEPAAGSGAFVRAAKTCGVKDIIAYDIDPAENTGGLTIEQRDFLAATTSTEHAKVCITNPPFGRNHSLSVPFFNKLAQTCDIIAFIVPRSWRKWSVTNRLDLKFVKIADLDLQVTYVSDSGTPLTTSTSLNTILQIWARSETPRARQPNPTPESRFEVVKPHEANATLTLFGRGCGTVRTEFEPKPNTTQMFLKATDDIIARLKKCDLSPFYSQVAYVEALSRKEIDYALEAQIEGRTIPHDILAAGNLTKHPGHPIAEHLTRGSFVDIAAEGERPTR